MINRKSKRGQGGSVFWIIAMIVAIAVLVITATGFIRGTNPIREAVNALFPGLWGGETPGLVEDGAFRYVVSQDSVQYYNGAKWVGFSLMNIENQKESAVQIENRIYKEKDVKEAFEKIYLSDNRVPEKILVIPEGNDNSRSFCRWLMGDTSSDGKCSVKDYEAPQGVGLIVGYPARAITITAERFASPKLGTSSEIEQGSVILSFSTDPLTVGDKNNPRIGTYTLPSAKFPLVWIDTKGIVNIGENVNGLTGSTFSIRKIDINNKYYSQLAQSTNAWRDSVLKQPINFAYTTSEKDPITGQIKTDSGSNNYCIEKIDSDLVVRLSKETLAGTCA